MLTELQFRLPEEPKLTGSPEEQIRQLSSHVRDVRNALSSWFASLNKPGGLAIVQRGVWTPTPTAASGTITTASATGEYSKLADDIYFFRIEATITTAGTGTGAINVTLPFTLTENLVGYGADTTVSFKGATITGGASAADANILASDGTTLIADGAVIWCAGFWICAD